MNLLTLLAYLVGHCETILRLAASRRSLAVGLVLVIVAGFAREYDGEDLLRQPWHLLIPLAASVASSAILYLLVRIVASGTCLEPPTLGGYLDFLGLYWLTAPLALVYAVPVERLMAAGDATRANLWMLGIVALWRVLLMARVVSVLYRVGFFAAFFVVMLFADTVAMILLVATDLPIVAIMGGIRLSESEMVLHDTVWTLRVLTVLSWPIWLIGALVVAFRKEPPWEYQATSRQPYPRVGWDLCLTLAALVGMWIAILPRTQPEQQLRGQVERDLRAGRIREALETMSAHEPGDFPPHWDPPPRLAYREQRPDITEVQEHLDVLPVKPWVREIYVEKFGNWLRGESSETGIWWELSAEGVERRIALIERMPERAELIRDHAEALEFLIDKEFGKLPPELQSRIRRLLDEAGVLSSANNSAETSTSRPAVVQ